MEILDKEQATAFHHSLEQLLFVIPRGRKYIHIAVYLLTKGVHEPENDDWRELQQLLQYLCDTIYIPLILRAESLNVIKWWVDILYEVH